MPIAAMKVPPYLIWVDFEESSITKPNILGLDLVTPCIWFGSDLRNKSKEDLVNAALTRAVGHKSAANAENACNCIRWNTHELSGPVLVSQVFDDGWQEETKGI
jgi:hypothetical protein